jgi:hypothetical protein
MVLLPHLLVGTEENYEKPQGSPCSSLDSNRAFPESKSDSLQVEQPSCSVCNGGSNKNNIARSKLYLTYLLLF